MLGLEIIGIIEISKRALSHRGREGINRASFAVTHRLDVHCVQMNYAWTTLFQLHLKFLFMRAIIKKSGLVEGPFSTLRVLGISAIA